MITLEKIKTRVEWLKQGNKLLLAHECFGIFELCLNPQQNRIIIKQEYLCTDAWNKIPSFLQEVQIASFLFWDQGFWYKIKPATSENQFYQALENLKIKYSLEEV